MVVTHPETGAFCRYGQARTEEHPAAGQVRYSATTVPISSTSFGFRNSLARIRRPSYVCQSCVSVLAVDIGMFGWKVGFGISD
jgi:hypothetical protein